MKYLNHIKISVLSIALLFLSNSCGDDFFDINTDPDAAIADQASPDLLFAPAITGVSANRMADAGWFTGLWAQQINQNGSSGLFRLIENYNQFQVIVQNLWNITYEDGLSNSQFAEQAALSADPPSPNAAAQAKLFSAWQYFYLTQFFGDIPFSEALSGLEIQTPVADSQRDVLVGIVAMVDEALAQIDLNNEAAPITSGDLFYGGNMDNWIRFGNTLKLKSLMFLAGREPEFRTQVANLINSGASFIEEASQNANAPFFDAPGNENNLFKFAVTIQPDGSAVSDTFYAGDELLDIMNAHSDPRTRIYFQPSRTATTNDIVANVSGSVGFNTEVSELSLNILRPDFPDRFLTAEETYLYMAEAYARGYVGGSPNLAAAEDALKDAIRVSLDFWNENIPTDPSVAVTDAARSAFMNTANIGGMTEAAALQRIYEEHYTTLLIRGSESWTFQRRVDFPALQAPPQALFADIPQRYLYPNEETASNPNIENVLGRTDPLFFKENQ